MNQEDEDLSHKDKDAAASRLAAGCSGSCCFAVEVVECARNRGPRMV